MHCLRDDSLQSLSVGSGDENEKSEKETVKLKRSLYFFCRNDDELFAELDRKLAVPLIPEFKDYFISELKNRGLLSPLRVCCIGRKFEGWHMNVSSEENEIAAVLEDGLKSGRIAIPGADPDAEDVFSDIRSFTQYLKLSLIHISFDIWQLRHLNEAVSCHSVLSPVLGRSHFATDWSVAAVPMAFDRGTATENCGAIFSVSIEGL